MKELLDIAYYFIHGKTVYPAIRRLLNLLLNICIASFFYEIFFGSYTWIDYKDYKAILDFFIKGQFFIPFSIFLVVYGITQFISETVFTLLNHIKSVKLQREILSYQFSKKTIDEKIAEIQPISRIIVPIDITPELIVKVYQELRKDLKPEVYTEIENELKEPRHNLQSNFILLFRALIGITIFKFSLPQYNLGLYIMTSIILLCSMYIMMLAYRLLDILPTLLRKFQHQAEEYLKASINSQKS